MPAKSTIYQLVIPERDRPTREILTALLDAEGIEAFEETNDALIIYDNKRSRLQSLIDALRLSNIVTLQNLRINELADENWNAKWEASFDPVYVGKFCAVRASFHPKDSSVTYDLIIDPEMAFGTGHHETTYLMIETMRDLDMEGKLVMDYGCGTAILAILAKKMEAAGVTGIDIDAVAIDCAKNCAALNNVKDIRLLVGDIELAETQKYDLVLANINRNILIDRALELKRVCKKGGEILLSGILIDDEKLIKTKYEEAGFNFLDGKHKGNWASLRFSNT